MWSNKKTLSGTPAATTLVALVFLLVGAEARTEPLVVHSFGFTYSPGRVEEFPELGMSLPSADTATELRTRYPAVGDVQLYCTAYSGPRFAYIDGVFYKLNEKARREGAYVATNEGQSALLDIDEPPSPFAGDFLIILDLVRDAGEGCRTL